MSCSVFNTTENLESLKQAVSRSGQDGPNPLTGEVSVPMPFVGSWDRGTMPRWRETIRVWI